MLEFNGLISGALAATTPILLAALGGAFTFRSGLFNIAMEGMLLVGAFCAVVGGFWSGSWLVGVGCGLLGGMGVALLFNLFAITLRTDEFVTGIALNLLALGGTTYALRQLFGVRGVFADTAIPGVPAIALPWAAGIPVLGGLLANTNLIIYLTVALTGLALYLLFRTRFGLRLRAAGHHPAALDAAGVSSRNIRAWSVIVCGLYCGLGGAYLATGYLRLFGENMSAGRGWIALAAIILTGGHPLGLAVICLLFGLTDSSGLLLQTTGLPPQLTDTLPYLATLIALFVYARRKKQSAGPLVV